MNHQRSAAIDKCRSPRREELRGKEVEEW